MPPVLQQQDGAQKAVPMRSTPNLLEWGAPIARSPDFRIYDEVMMTPAAKPPDSGHSAPPITRIFALIPCAGQGKRAALRGESSLFKQYQTINGKPMVIHTVEAFRAVRSLIASLWLVISPDDDDFLNVFPGYGDEGETLCRGGGSTRSATVLNGLKAMLLQAGGASPGDWVLVHDAARCLVTPLEITRLIEVCQTDAVGGLLAQPLADTLKSGQAGRVASTLDRSDKWLAQTPQMFRIGALIEALEIAAQQGQVVTDESSAMEAMGLSPVLVPGSAQNFKVTYPEDFALAEAVLSSRT